MTLTLPSATGQGYLLLAANNEVMELAGEVELPAESDVAGAVLIAPSPALIDALPTWVLNQAMVIAGASNEIFTALTSRSDLRRLTLTSAISASILQLVGNCDLQPSGGEPIEIDAEKIANLPQLREVELLNVSLSDAGFTALASLDHLEVLRVRSDQLTGEAITSLEPIAAQLTYLQLAGEQLLGGHLNTLPTLASASAASFMGPHIFADLNARALRQALPAVEFLNLFGEVTPDDDVEESEQSFRRLLPFRAAFAGVDVNGLQLTEKGAKRAAKRLGVDLVEAAGMEPQGR